MAVNLTVQSVLDTIRENHLKCPICKDCVKQPKQLNCLHTFCLGCLQTLIKESNNPHGQKLSCPMCRVETEFEKDDVAGLPSDFKLLALLEEMQSLEEQLKSREYVPKCGKHNQDLNVYCYTCKKLQCPLCIVFDQEHSHSLIEVPKALDKLKHDVAELVAKVKMRLSAICQSRKKLDSFFSETNKKISKKAEREVARIREEEPKLKQEVQKLKQEEQRLKQEAEEIYKKRVKIFETAQAKNSKKVTRADHKLDEVNRLKTQASCYEMLDFVEKISHDLKQWTGIQPEELSDGLAFMDFEEGEGSLGRLVLQELETRAQANVQSPLMIPLRFSLTEKWKFKREIKKYRVKFGPWKQLKFAFDVASFSNNEMIIADTGNKQLITFSPESNSQATANPQRVQINGLADPGRVAVNMDDRLIVLDHQEIKIFNREYQLIRPFTPSSRKSTRIPSCIAVDDNNLIAIGYMDKGEIHVYLHNPYESSKILSAPMIGGYLTIFKQRFIYTNQLEGKLESVDLNSGRVFSVGIKQHGRPRGVCCGTDGSIYVAVKNELSSEIQRYSPDDGEYLGCVIQDCGDPHGITLTSGGEMVVAAVDSVKIYHRV